MQLPSLCTGKCYPVRYAMPPSIHSNRVTPSHWFATLNAGDACSDSPYRLSLPGSYSVYRNTYTVPQHLVKSRYLSHLHAEWKPHTGRAAFLASHISHIHGGLLWRPVDFRGSVNTTALHVIIHVYVHVQAAVAGHPAAFSRLQLCHAASAQEGSSWAARFPGSCRCR